MSGAENGLQNVHPVSVARGALMVRGTYIVKQCTFFVSDIKHKDKDEIYLKMGIEGTDIPNVLLWSIRWACPTSVSGCSAHRMWLHPSVEQPSTGEVALVCLFLFRVT